MPADIKLGEGAHSEWVTIAASVLSAESSDVMIDSPSRRKKSGGYRRALVHDFEDGLTINFSGDYPGGVTLRDARLNIRHVVQGPDPELPQHATPGDVLFIYQAAQMGSGPPDPLAVGISSCSLWICIPHEVGVSDAAWWQRIPLEDPVQGTA